MSITFDNTKMKKEMKNIIDYSLGFLEGIDRGKNKFLNNLGKSTIEVMKEFVDSNARVNPSALHHVYEWHRTGSPDARLFDLEYTVSGLGLSIKSSLRQSNSVKNGSYTPFYNKARIMEDGVPVTIRPKRAKVLVFEDDGETVFTKGPVRIDNPGGVETTGALERTLETFINSYFTQAFFQSSGLKQYLENPVIYKTNVKAGARMGRSKGIDTGYKWIVNAGVNL